MSDRTFVDTDILVYAHDADPGEKSQTASSTLSESSRGPAPNRMKTIR